MKQINDLFLNPSKLASFHFYFWSADILIIDYYLHLAFFSLESV